MFINPKVAIEKGWIKGIKDAERQVQPNAIDFTLDQLFMLDNDVVAQISEQTKTSRPLHKWEVESNGYWHLEGHQVFDGMSDVYVEVPQGVAAILFTRSTFARNGVLIASGLYDAGYKGHIGFTIYTHGGPIEIAPGTRIGQIGFALAPSAKMYAGQYNHEQGEHYTDKSTAQFLEQHTRISIEGDSKPAGIQTFL